MSERSPQRSNSDVLYDAMLLEDDPEKRAEIRHEWVKSLPGLVAPDYRVPVSVRYRLGRLLRRIVRKDPA